MPSEAEIKAATKALYRAWGGTQWREAPDIVQEMYRKSARAVLKAAEIAREKEKRDG